MESIWMSETKIRKRESLPGDIEASAVVIGAGLTGILTAYYLKQAGIQTVVLEADRIGSGQTKNTTAKITSQHGLIYDRLTKSFGSRMAAHYAMANERAVGEYERLILEKEIACDFVRCPAFLYSEDMNGGEAALRKEAAAAKALGIEASFEKDSELPFSIAGTVKFENQARFHPLKFLDRLSGEVTVYEGTKALKVEGGRVMTEKGCVTAEYVVFASHFPFINVPGYYFARMYQERSYAAALTDAAEMEGMYLGIDRGGLSFRSRKGMLLIGGGSHRTGVNRQGGRYAMLRGRAQKLYPGCRETAHWSAQDCMTLDGVPYIGRFSAGKSGWYVATGFGKWGMTGAMVSARILTSLIAGCVCEEADIFSPQRRMGAGAAKEFLSHGIYTVKGLSKHFLPYGRGEIIPNCPHMGCRMEWNPETQSYDCPCHGSRFDSKGRLLDDPAQTDCRKKRLKNEK